MLLHIVHFQGIFLYVVDHKFSHGNCPNGIGLLTSTHFHNIAKHFGEPYYTVKLYVHQIIIDIDRDVFSKTVDNFHSVSHKLYIYCIYLINL